MNSELVRRIAFTLGALLVYRLSLNIPIPGISPAVRDLLSHRAYLNGMAGLLGGTSLTSIGALGLTPYISAAIIVQLVSIVSSRLRALPEKGEAGRRTIIRLTLGVWLVLAAFQAFGVASGLQALVADHDGSSVLVATVSLLAGTCFLIWLSELITRYGIGNGIALLLSVNILASLPPNVAMTFELSRQGALSGNLLLCDAVLSALVVTSMVFVECARRPIPVEFGSQKRPASLSLKLNSAGLMPVVLAPLVFSLPILLMSSFGAPQYALAALAKLGGSHIAHAIVIFLLATYYASFVLDPEKAAYALGKRGGAIPGVAPGEPTAAYLDRAMSPTALIGAVYITAQMLLWEAWTAYGNGAHSFGGVSALIVVCTILDTKKQVRDMRSPREGNLR